MRALAAILTLVILGTGLLLEGQVSVGGGSVSGGEAVPKRTFYENDFSSSLGAFSASCSTACDANHNIEITTSCPGGGNCLRAFTQNNAGFARARLRYNNASVLPQGPTRPDLNGDHWVCFQAYVPQAVLDTLRGQSCSNGQIKIFRSQGNCTGTVEGNWDVLVSGPEINCGSSVEGILEQQCESGSCGDNDPVLDPLPGDTWKTYAIHYIRRNGTGFAEVYVDGVLATDGLTHSSMGGNHSSERCDFLGVSTWEIGSNKAISTISRSSNVVTATTSAAHQMGSDSVNIDVSGVTDASFNGTNFDVTAIPSSTQVQWNQTGSDASSGGGTITLPNAALGEVFYKNYWTGNYRNLEKCK
ncbi:MAG TPA: hypothetical protein VNK82_10080 [Terriglobales bacterium]|nr:hypothetical protein [Terriglobales bacterium]